MSRTFVDGASFSLEKSELCLKVEHVNLFAVDGDNLVVKRKDTELQVLQKGGTVTVYVEKELLKITLRKDVPVLCMSPSTFLFIEQHHFHIVQLPGETKEFVDILTKHSAYVPPVMVVPKKVEGETETTKKVTAAASSVESGGVAISQGMIKGAEYIGLGIKKTSQFVIANTDKGHRQVTEEEKRKLDESQQSTQKFLSGTRTVVGGFGKGAAFLGQGIAKIATDVAPKSNKPESANKAAAVSFAGATANAFGSIKTGIWESSKIISSNVKENAVEVKKHREGEEAAQLTEQRYNMAGQVAVGGINAVNIASTAVDLPFEAAISVGAAAVTYDTNWSRLMDGPAWITGWLSSQDRALDPWTSKWFVLRTYALATYKDNFQDPLKPASYLPLLEIKYVEAVPFAITKKNHCVKVVTKSSTLFLSVECTDRTQQNDHNTQLQIWMYYISTLKKLCCGEINVQ